MVWEWGRKSDEYIEGIEEARRRGDLEEYHRLIEEHKEFQREHPPGRDKDPIESLERRVGDLEKRIPEHAIHD